MGKALVIVESPAKAKTINKYLGPDFIVKSSVGHIRDLPTGSRSSTTPSERAQEAAKTRKMSPEERAAYKSSKAHDQLIQRMGVDPEHGWKAHYTILPGKEKVVEELRRLARNADAIYLATDLDREGEAIAWHLREAIGGDETRYRRVVFNEITRKAIQEAFQQPGDLDMNRVNAQQARRFLDRVVGFMVSPLLWKKIARGLSAGRVQSVAVRLIVEREREIRAFIPEEYWEVDADLAKATEAATFKVAKYQGKTFRPANEAETTALVENLRQQTFKVAAREDKPTTSKTPPPFITSTLQQAASTRLGFSVKKTMMLAQRLYEAGYITYMRTDSTNLSAEAVQACRAYIEKKFGADYLPPKPKMYGSREGAQEAHEAIRPTDVNVMPSDLKGLEKDADRLYELIWRQFVACQMADVKAISTRVQVQAGDFELRTSGRIVTFEGFYKVLPPPKKDGESLLPDFRQGDVLDLRGLKPTQHFTKPAPRYSEAALVKELEKRGIGRPSTYASIISTIQERGYVSLKNRRFYAEKMGDIVTDRLVESFPNLMDYSFTASMEEELDLIAEGREDWIRVLDNFYADFSSRLEKAAQDEGGMRGNIAVETDIRCPDCGRPMLIRNASTGVFLGCSGYSLPPKERCKKTINLVPGEEAVAVNADEDDESESRLIMTKRRCGKCGSTMDPYLIDESRRLHICGNNPDCPGWELEQGQFKIKGYDGPVLECDKCGANMELKNGRFGKYFGCTNEACKNTRKLLKNGEPAPPKMDPVPMPELRCEKVDDTYVLRDGASGIFLAASKFPKNRETRPPKVSELIPHKAEIDPKYHYLLEAPVADPEGNPAIIRFSRKTKQQYVMSEKNGKPTGWTAFYEDGRWQVREGKSTGKSRISGGRKPKAKA
ncbi:MAG: type I DNA topoisomerase [Gammaproteobacteria bacterium]|nr:MAG: type I DNA topoisomerase [Gammaproteobacteria bacterium]